MARYLKALMVLLLGMVSGCMDPEVRLAQHMEEGWAYLEDGNFAKARVEFQNALKIEPNDPDARYALGRAMQALDRPRGAVGHYRVAVDLDSEHVPARVALAKLYLFSGLSEGADELIDEALAVAPDNGDALAVKAGSVARLQGSEAAAPWAERALAVDPRNHSALSLQSSILMRQGHQDRAISLLQAAVGREPDAVDLRRVFAQVLLESGLPDRAIEQLGKIARLEPETLNHRVVLARTLAMVGRADEAERELGQAVASLDTTEARLALARFLTRQRGAEAAAEALQQMVRDRPDNHELALALAEVQEGTGRADAAEATYRSILQADDVGARDAAAARVGVARLLIDAGRVDEAEQAVEAVLEEEPTNPRGLVLRSSIALGRGDPQSAIADLRAALRDDPNSAEVQQFLAMAYLADGQPRMAREALLNAVQSDPANVEARRLLYDVAMREQDWELALTQARALGNAEGAARESLERQYRVEADRGDLEEALQTADQIARVDPESGLGHLLAGAALLKLDRNAEAEERWLGALTRQPDAIEPLAALVRLYLEEERVEDAVALLEERIDASPEHRVARNMLGEIALSGGRLDSAESAFVQTIRLAPDWWMPYRGLARTHLQRSNVGQAERVYRQGVSRSGDERLRLELALLLEKQGRTESAVAVYEEALAEGQGGDAMRNNYAMLLVSHRNDPSSLARALELAEPLGRREDPAMLDTAGWVNYKAGDLSSAERLMKKAVNLAPDAPLLRFHLAQVLADLGRESDALSHLDAALASGDFGKADAARQLKARLSGGGAAGG